MDGLMNELMNKWMNKAANKISVIIYTDLHRNPAKSPRKNRTDNSIHHQRGKLPITISNFPTPIFDNFARVSVMKISFVYCSGYWKKIIFPLLPKRRWKTRLSKNYRRIVGEYFFFRNCAPFAESRNNVCTPPASQRIFSSSNFYSHIFYRGISVYYTRLTVNTNSFLRTDIFHLRARAQALRRYRKREKDRKRYLDAVAHYTSAFVYNS